MKYITTIIIFTLFLLTNCQENPNSHSDKPEAINVFPSSINLEKGSSQLFSVEVIGQNKEVVWSIEGEGIETSTFIDNTGNLYIGYNENSLNITVYARSNKYKDLFGSATVNVLPYISKAVISQEVVEIFASKSDATGNGSVEANTNIVINLLNATTMIDAINIDVSSWFNKIIPGLTYLGNFEKNSSIIEINITGNPLVTSFEDVYITIPINILKDMEDIVINYSLIIEGNIFYSINEGMRLKNLEELQKYLNSIPVNTPDKPYSITLESFSSVNELFSTIYTSIGVLESGYGYRYVALNLLLVKDIVKWSNITVNQDAKNQIISIILPNSITEIESYAFENSNNLKYIIGTNVNLIGYATFYSCINLIEINFPNLTSIGNFGFMYCSKLESIYFPVIKYINHQAFYNCISLKTVILPEVTSLSMSSFEGCSNLETLEIINLVEIDMQVFKNCVKLKNINFPLLRKIGYSSFYNCTLLETVNIPSIENIGNDVFRGCINLSSFTFGNIPPNITLMALSDNSITTLNVYIPNGTLALYQLWYSNLNLYNIIFNFIEI